MSAGRLRFWRTGLSSILHRGVGTLHRRSVDDSWRYSADEVEQVHSRGLDETLHHALATVPYYRARVSEYQEALSTPGSMAERLRQLPVLTKATLRANQSEFVQTPRPFGTISHTTSGTTGTPLRLHATLSERAFANEVLYSFLQRTIGTRRPRMLLVTGMLTPPAGDPRLFMKEPLTGNAFISIYSMTEETAPALQAFIESFRPDCIYGYTNSIVRLARLVQLPQEFRRRTLVLVTSELLTDYGRTTIESSLGAVRNLYGSQEGAHLALECEFGGWHSHPSVGFVEVLRNDGTQAQPGEQGRVIVTGFLRRVMPLIRYELGDEARVVDPSIPCECGLSWPRVGSVVGRSEDFALSSTGARVPLLDFHGFKDLTGIAELQVEQLAIGRYLCRVVLADRGPLTSAEKAQVRRQFELRLRERPEVTITYVDSIPRGPNGKFKAMVIPPELRERN